MAIEIKYSPEETFKFDEFTFNSTKRSISQIVCKIPSYQDIRRISLVSLEHQDKPEKIIEANLAMAVKLTGLAAEEFSELPAPIAQAIMGFINLSGE